MNIQTLGSIDWKRLWGLANIPFLHIGETSVSVTGVFSGMLVFLGFVFFSFAVRNWMIRRLTRRFGVEEAVSFSIRRVAHYGLLTLGIVFAFQAAGFSMSSVTVMLGFLSVGIGFGMQNITSNFISGVILLFERPISVGDMITLEAPSQSIAGIVRTIGLRSTIVRTFDNVNVIVPNSQFVESQVINWSYREPEIRIHVPIGVAYGSDTGKLKKILLRIAEEHPGALKKPAPHVRFLGFGDSSLDFELLVWIARPEERLDLLSEFNFAIDDALRREGIEIPFPQRDLHLKMTPAVEKLACSR